MKNPYKVSDELWEVIKQYIPAQQNYDPGKEGRPHIDDHNLVDVILFVTKTGFNGTS